MQILPKSTLYLCKDTNLDPNYNYTIDFDTIEAQATFFENKVASEFNINSDYTFIKNGSVRVQANLDELFGINYLFFENSDKRYYAFITNKTYSSANCTIIEYKIDTYQSFMFDFKLDESFVDREHQDRYKNPKHYIPIYNLEDEQLNIGDHYEIESSIKPLSSLSSWYLIKTKEPIAKIYGSPYTEDKFGTTIETNTNTGIYCYVVPVFSENPKKITTYSLGSISGDLINDSDFTTKYSFAKISELSQNPNVISIQKINYMDTSFFNISLSGDPIRKYNFRIGITAEFSKGIVYISGIDGDDKRLLIRIVNYDSEENDGGFIKTFSVGQYTGDLGKMSIEQPADIKFEPKLYTNPYRYTEIFLYGEQQKYYDELFKNGGKIKLISSLSPNNTLMMLPIDYRANETSGNFDKKVLSTKNEITLRTDAWQQYLLNNKASVNGGLAVAGGQVIASSILGLLTGGFGIAQGAQQAVNFAGQVANTMLKRKDIQQTPDEVRAVGNDLSVLETAGLGGLEILKMTIQEKFKNKIYNYFKHYGYKCNDFKEPNLRSRYYYNYIKTVGANINTNIDSEFRNELEQIFNNGITIWHFRDAITFKGINNYKFENMEINLMEENNGKCEL